MNAYIALLRGINVGGKNKLPMADLRQVLGDTGFKQVETYIQSGNVVFKSAQLSPEKIAACIAEQLNLAFSISTPVLVLKAEDFRSIIENNPFASKPNLEKALHCFFLDKPAATAHCEKLHKLKLNSEAFKLSERCFYLWAPEGIGRSKLAASAEKTLGVTTTARNWRTVSRLMEMSE